MAVVGLGIESYAMVGEEVTYGTPVARTHGIKINSESLECEENDVVADSLYDDDVHSGEVAKGAVTAGGSIEQDWRFGNRASHKLLYHLLGAKAIATPDPTSAPTVRRHTFTPTLALPTGLSVEIVKGSKGHLFSGCKVQSMRFSFTAAGKVVVATQLMAEDLDSVVDPPTALVLSEAEGNVASVVDSVVTWDGVTQDRVLSGEITIENPLERNQFVGSRFTVEPTRSDKRRVSGQITFQVGTVAAEGSAIYGDYRSRTRRAMTVLINGDVIAGGLKYYLKFTVPVARLVGSPIQNADRRGVLAATAAFAGHTTDAEVNAITVETQNILTAV